MEHSAAAMDATGEIEIRIEGSVGAQKLTPALVDIEETFVDLFDYDLEYSDSYLDGLMKKAAPAWEGVPNADEWLDEIRGGAHV